MIILVTIFAVLLGVGMAASGMYAPIFGILYFVLAGFYLVLAVALWWANKFHPGWEKEEK